MVKFLCGVRARVEFFRWVRVSVRGLMGFRVRALGISKVMTIRARGAQPPPHPPKWILADSGRGIPEAVRGRKGQGRIGPSFARFQLPIHRASMKLAGLRVRESMGSFDSRDLRYAAEIARAALYLGPPVRYGAKNGGITNGVRNFRGSWEGLAFSFRRHPIYGGFASLVPPRWLLGVDVHLPRDVSRKPPWPHGALRGGKMAEIRLESGILRIFAPAFCFLSSPPRLRKFCVFSDVALGAWGAF